MKLNEKQQQAVSSIHGNVCLVAGAGTGKTAVLTERYLELLRHGHLPQGKEIRSIVAITFTEKAAEEMKRRIQTRLEGARDEFSHLEGQTGFRIATIHSFCAQLMREDPAGFGVDPNFTVLDEPTARGLLMESLTESYEKLSDQSYGDVIRAHGWYGHGNFLTDLMNLNQQLRAAHVDLDTLQKACRIPETPVEGSDEALLKSLTEALVKPDKRSRLYRFFQKDGMHERLEGSFEERHRLYLDMAEDRAADGKTTEALRDVLVRYVAEAQTSFNPSYTFIFCLLAKARAAYWKKKQALAALDYDDLQEMVLKRLDDPSTLAAVQSDLHYLMIDECQDINDLQAAIFYRICSKEKPLDRKNLFVVGDPRQSIYGFRYARAELFEQLQKDIEKTGGETISMQRNYRCSSQILTYVNDVFRTGFPGLDELEAGSDTKSVCIEWCAPEEDEEQSTEADAQRVRDQLLALKEDGVRWDEIALLFRASGKMHIYEDILRRAEIPALNLSSRSFWMRQELLDLLSVALIATEQADDVWWLTFLRSPLAGISDEKLERWRANGTNWEERLMAAKYDDEAAAQALSRVRDAQRYLQAGHLPGLIRQLRQTYDVYCAAGEDAERRLANLERLSAWLFDKSKTEYRRPKDLALQWLLRTQVEEEEAEPAESEDGRVTLMTIHKAKGLEKRVIFLIGIDASPNHQVDTFLYEEEKVHIRGSARHELAAQIRREKEKKEELRLLYVALTRAKESLYLTSQTGKNQNFFAMLSEAGFSPEQLPRTKAVPAQTPTRKQRQKEDLVRLVQRTVLPQTRAYSASQLMLFTRCPRAWFLRYRLGLKEEIADEQREIPFERNEDFDLTGAEKGSLFHALVESDAGGPAELHVTQTADRLGMTLTHQEFTQLRAWLSHVRNTVFTGSTEHELTFDWERDGVLWTGSIDLVETDVPRIYDLKTNRSAKHLEAVYAPQLQFYALAYRALRGDIPETLLWWLPGNKKCTIDTTKAALQRTEETMDRFAEFVHGHDRITSYDCTDACDPYCQFATVCAKFPR